jgi:ribonuclease HI
MYIVHTDGSCLGNPGPGGIGIVILKDGNVIDELSFGDPHTTNNKMELTAVISAISYIRSEYNYTGNIEILTDSKYVVDGMNSWRHGWKKKGWRDSKNKPVKNLELWQLLDSIGNECTYTHEYGHSGNVYNEMANDLAQNAAKEM